MESYVKLNATRLTRQHTFLDTACPIISSGDILIASFRNTSVRAYPKNDLNTGTLKQYHTTHSDDMAAKPLGKIAASETALFVCDVQERFRQVISGMPAVIDTAKRMVWYCEGGLHGEVQLVHDH